MKNPTIPVVWYSDVKETDIKVDSPEWFIWLQSVPSFSYQSADGKFTARKRGNFWNAYRKSFGKLRQEYLGTTANLTLDRLQEVAKLMNLSDLHYWRLKAEQRRERTNSYVENCITTREKPTSHTGDCIANIPSPLHAAQDEAISSLKDRVSKWEEKVKDSCTRSGGVPSERYRYVNRLVQELREILVDTNK
jgi:hypothetical protein